ARAGMKPIECRRVLGGRDLSIRHRCVVGPEGDREAVTQVDARLYSWVEGSDGTPGCCELLCKLDLELGHLVACTGDSSNDVTREQAQRELVRVLKNDRVIGPQVTC